MTRRRDRCSLLLLAVLAGCAGDIGPGAEAEPGAVPAATPTGGTSPHSPPSAPSGAPGPASGSAPQASCRRPEAPPARIWKLTPGQYSRTLEQLVGPAATSRVGEELAATLARKAGFSNEAAALEMAEPHVNQLLATAGALAAAASGDPRIFPCQTADAACLRSFASGFGQKAFRRPLAPAELDAYAAYLQRQATASGPRTAARLFITGVLMSPSFLFRTELGPDGARSGSVVSLTPHEKASALSYFLTDGPPDPALIVAASSGGLDAAAQIEAQGRRLLASPASSAGVVRFLSEHFDFEGVLTVNKDAKAFPAWRATLGADLAREAELFVEQVLWREDGKLSTLLTAPFSVVNARLAAHYGIRTAVPTDFAKTALPPGRIGLLMQGGLMAFLARDNDTDPVRRGLFLREHLLCSPPPPPPPTINVTAPPPDGQRTQRERLGQHSSDPTCSPCHALLDPLGLAFETFDGIGRQRTTDVGKPIDTAGVLASARPEGASFRDAGELAGILARSPDVAACMVTKAFEYAHGRAAGDQDSCVLSGLATKAGASASSLLDLMLAIVADDTFASRRLP